MISTCRLIIGKSEACYPEKTLHLHTLQCRIRIFDFMPLLATGSSLKLTVTSQQDIT